VKVNHQSGGGILLHPLNKSHPSQSTRTPVDKLVLVTTAVTQDSTPAVLEVPTAVLLMGSNMAAISTAGMQLQETAAFSLQRRAGTLHLIPAVKMSQSSPL
ncbi:hypothetical protein XENOCAPTIV_021043, partial [Xenoophorus captivus]